MTRGFAQNGPGGHPIDAVCRGLAAPLTPRERALAERVRRGLCGRCRRDASECVCQWPARPATVLPPPHGDPLVVPPPPAKVPR